VILREEFGKRPSGGNWIGRASPQQTVALGEARGLTGQRGVIVDPVKEITARFEEVDLVRRDQGPELVLIVLDALDDLAILLRPRVDRQIAADQLNVAESKLLRPGGEQPRGCRLSCGDADEGEMSQVARVREARRACSL
jgi:hypothetical protein